MTSVDDHQPLMAPRRLRFSLHTLLVVLTLTGVSLGVWNFKNTGWSDALRAVATALIVIGTSEQVLDLLKSWRTKRQRNEQLRCAWEVSWRVVLAMILVAFAMASIYDRVVFSTDVSFAYLLASHSTIGWQLTFLVLVAEMFSPPVRRATTIRENSYALLIWYAILGLALFIASGLPTLDFLVMAAIKGVQGAQASMWHGQPFYPFEPNYERWETFKLAGYLAMPILAATFLAGWTAIKAYRRWVCIVSSLTMLLLLGLLFVGNWWAQSELWALVPFRQPIQVFQDGYHSSLLLAILALFATAATVVLLREMPSAKNWPTMSAGLRSLGHYTHERRLPLALIGVVALQPAVERFYDYARMMYGPWWGFAGSIADALCAPSTVLSLLGGWVVLRTFWRLCKPGSRERDPLVLSPFHPVRASLIWIIVVLLLFTTLASFYWITWAYLMRDYGGQT